MLVITVSLVASEFSNDELLTSSIKARWRAKQMRRLLKGYPFAWYYLEAQQLYADGSANFV